jgi:hypothetical protein
MVLLKDNSIYLNILLNWRGILWEKHVAQVQVPIIDIVPEIQFTFLVYKSRKVDQVNRDGIF